MSGIVIQRKRRFLHPLYYVLDSYDPRLARCHNCSCWMFGSDGEGVCVVRHGRISCAITTGSSFAIRRVLSGGVYATVRCYTPFDFFVH